ncbi:hypothetical protein [Micromonospora schwarzwaldensis]|uniref:hypothetical protein n=1 Tax=Micromonospora sp. DSM 45708 TaxID=3111767 RepID=UPI0031E05635
MEHEYRWHLGKGALAAPEASEELREQLIQASGLRLHEQARISQHTLCFDSPDWSLTSVGCSLTALVNRGAGPSWLVAKETVQWVDGRRDVLELTEYVADLVALSGADLIASRPGQYLARRASGLCGLSVFGYLSQRRTKATLRTDDNAVLALSCDAVELRDACSRLVNTFAILELEVNQASRANLDLLSRVAGKFSALVGRAPADTTKPQIAATHLGWGSQRGH